MVVSRYQPEDGSEDGLCSFDVLESILLDKVDIVDRVVTTSRTTTRSRKEAEI